MSQLLQSLRGRIDGARASGGSDQRPTRKSASPLALSSQSAIPDRDQGQREDRQARAPRAEAHRGEDQERDEEREPGLGTARQDRGVPQRVRELRARGLRSGAVEVLFKPVGETELVAAIAKALDEPRRRERTAP